MEATEWYTAGICEQEAGSAPMHATTYCPCQERNTVHKTRLEDLLRRITIYIASVVGRSHHISVCFLGGGGRVTRYILGCERNPVAAHRSVTTKCMSIPLVYVTADILSALVDKRKYRSTGDRPFTPATLVLEIYPLSLSF